MRLSRGWWKGAVEKANLENLVSEIEHEAYNERSSRSVPVKASGATTAATETLTKSEPPKTSEPPIKSETPHVVTYGNGNGKRKKLGYELNETGARRLVAAVVEKAIEDYRFLVSHGGIVDGNAMPSKTTKKDGTAYQHEDEIKELLDFFRPGGPMDNWLRAAGININPNLIRKKLGIE